MPVALPDSMLRRLTLAVTAVTLLAAYTPPRNVRAAEPTAQETRSPTQAHINS